LRRKKVAGMPVDKWDTEREIGWGVRRVKEGIGNKIMAGSIKAGRRRLTMETKSLWRE
jgi:hypothetical protein